jgi:hypothetical protein
MSQLTLLTHEDAFTLQHRAIKSLRKDVVPGYSRVALHLFFELSWKCSVTIPMKS